MPTVEKLIEKMKAQPNGIRAEEIKKVLSAYGYRLDRQKGSHMQFISDTGDVLTIPDKSPLRAVYVKDVLNRISNRGI